MKLLASDYDKTLFFGVYKPEDVKAIKRFQKEGNKFAVDTGRAIHQLEEQYPEEHPIEIDAYICDSGATVAGDHKKIFYQAPLDFDLLKRMLEFAPETDITINADGIYSTLKPSKRFEQFGQTRTIENLDDLKDMNVTSLSYYFDTEEQARNHYEAAAAAFPELSCQVNRTSVDCILAGNSKATGLKKLSDQLGIQEKDVYAIGDSYNDVPMLKEANTSFLIDTAPIPVKEELKGKVIEVASIAQAIEMIEKGEV